MRRNCGRSECKTKLCTNRCDGQHVEDFGAVAPRVGVPIFGLTLVCKKKTEMFQKTGHVTSSFNGAQLTVETVNLGDLPALVVPPQQRDAVGPLGLQHQQVRERLQAVVPSVHEVALQTTARSGAPPTNVRETRGLTMKM